MTPGHLFCAHCRRHYPGARRVCPLDGVRLVPVAAERLSPGAMLSGRFILGEEVAAGGMARIFRAVDATTGAVVAVKALKASFVSRPHFVDQFFREARAIRRIEHDNVVRMFDFGRTAEGHLFIAMEYLAGPPLSQVSWERGALPVDVSLRLFSQVIAALQAAHAVSVVHADLKAGNVIVASAEADDERIKVVDFGLARLHDLEAREVQSDAGGEARTTLGVAGTPQYMSPEQIRGEEVDARTDLYAAGVLLFQLLTGRVPFDHDDPAEVCRMHLELPPPRLSDQTAGPRLPFAVEHLVQRLLAKDPEARPASAALVFDETKEALRRAGFPTLPPELAAPAPPVARLAAARSAAVAASAVEPAHDAVARAVTLLDVEFRGDERPFTLLDDKTLAFVWSPLAEAITKGIAQADGAILERDGRRIRVGFGLVGDAVGRGPDQVTNALDLAEGLIARVGLLNAALQLGVAVRCGIATGTVWHCPADDLAPCVLVRGSRPDLAARLVQLAPWGGMALDDRTLRQSGPRLPALQAIAVPIVIATRSEGAETAHTVAGPPPAAAPSLA